MTVVRNEFERARTAPSRVLSQRMMSTAYHWHNYGKSTIGNRTDIERVPIDRLQAFYRKLLSARQRGAGRRRQVRRAQRRSSSSPSTSARFRSRRGRLTRLYTEEPTQDGERAVTLRRVGDVQSRLMSAYHVPAGADPDFAALDLVVLMLGDDTLRPAAQRRWSKRSRPARCSVEISSSTIPGTAYFAAQVRQDQSLDTARDSLLKIVEAIATTPPTAEELERARKTS